MIRWRLWLGAALGGGAAVMIVLALLLPLHLLFGLEYAPQQAADYIIETSIPDVALALQETLGAFSLPSAVLGGIMFVAMLGIPVGLLYRWLTSYSRPIAMIAACAAAPILVRTVFPNVTILASSPLLLTGFILDWLLRRDLVQGQVNVGRRQFLVRSALFSLGGIALALINAVPTVISELRTVRALRQFFPFTPPPPRAAGFDVPGLSPEITPVQDFYKMRKFPTPIPDIPADWKLEIGGLVETPLTLSLDELTALPRTDTYLTRQCISNPVGGNLISTALMSGIPLRDLLARAKVRGSATEVVFYGRDGYSETIDLAYGIEHGLITYALNGTALPEVHGAPVRVEMLGLYGFKSLKWLDKIEVIDYHYVAIWEEQGYTADPVVKTMSRIDVAAADANAVQAAGVAFAGRRGISRVEVRINDDDWQDASLHIPPLSDLTWVQWRAELPAAAAGSAAAITVRAVDGNGDPQIEAVQPQKPDGASGLHRKAV